jgi:hypothetical protein
LDSDEDGDSMKKSFPGLALALAVAALAVFRPCPASAARFQEQAYRYKDCQGKPGVTRVPLFAGKAHDAGAMIDNYIHMAFFETAPPLKPIPEPLPVVTGSFFDRGFELFQAKVADVLGGRVVQVSFSWSQCDVVVDAATITYAFDTRTGRLIAEPDLFTPDGKIKLQRLLLEQRRQRLAKEIRRQEGRIAKAKNKSDRQREEDSKALYESCLDDRFGPEKPSNSDAWLGMTGFSERGIVFEDSACSTQADAALDDIQRFVNTVEVTKAKPYLSAYGRYLFLGEGDGKITPDSAAAQFFHGKVGDAPVTMYLSADRTASAAIGPMKFSTGAYFYDKYRNLIPLAVTPQSATNYVLEERDDNLKVTSAFSVNFDKTGLRGTWRSASRRLPVEAGRQVAKP